MTLYGYARVSIREPEDKNLDLQVERLVRAGCSMGNIRAEEASGAKDDRGGLLELLDLVVEGDTLVVTHIDRLSRGLTYGLQVIEGLHHAGVEFRSLSEDFDTSTATGKLQLQMVLAFSEWWRNSIRDRSVAGQAKARAEGRFPGRRPSLTAQQRDYIRVERSKGVSQRELAKLLEVIVGVGPGVPSRQIVWMLRFWEIPRRSQHPWPSSVGQVRVAYANGWPTSANRSNLSRCVIPSTISMVPTLTVQTFRSRSMTFSLWSEKR